MPKLRLPPYELPTDLGVLMTEDHNIAQYNAAMLAHANGAANYLYALLCGRFVTRKLAREMADYVLAHIKGNIESRPFASPKEYFIVIRRRDNLMNLLEYPISSSILTLVEDILEFYRIKVSIRQSITINESKGQFKYSGFYTKDLPISCDKHIKPTIAHVKSNVSDEIPDLTYSDQHKPERDGNVYILRLDKSKVFVRVRTHNCGCEYEEIPIVKYDNQ